MRLHVREWGGGDRIAVLIHGLSGWSATWNAVGPELASRGYRVLAPDLRGHGESPRGRYSSGDWVSDLVETLPQAPELAVGHSMGGALLLEATARLRPRFAVYEDPAWRLAPNPEQAIAEFEKRKALTLEDIATANPRWPEEVVRARHAGLALWDPATARAFIGGNGERTPSARPAGPSLVLLAQDSPYVPAPAADRLRGLGWRVQTLAGTGHHLHVDDRPAFMTSVAGWLAGSAAANPDASG